MKNWFLVSNRKMRELVKTLDQVVSHPANRTPFHGPRNGLSQPPGENPPITALRMYAIVKKISTATNAAYA